MSTFHNAGEDQAITLTETGHMDNTDIYKHMKKKFSRLLVGFSAAQIIIGILCFIINGVTLGKLLHDSYMTSFPIFGYGFVTGLMFIVTGAIGMASGKGKKKCLIVSFNVLSIISASLCSYLFIFSTISLSVGGERCRYSYYRDTSYCRSEADTFALETVLAILAFMEVGCAIGASVVCCTIGACCCDCDCGCCCPPTLPRYKSLDNGVQPTRMQDRPQPTGMPYQQPATILLYPSQPTYMPGANQMSIPPGQQQPVIPLNPNQQVAQYSPPQVPASSNFQNREISGMRSSMDANQYEELEVFNKQARPNVPQSIAMATTTGK